MNRKEQIENLENEISEKQKIIDDLRKAEDQEQEQEQHPDQTIIDEFIDNLNI